MNDALAVFESESGIEIAVCLASAMAREAAARHHLRAGSGAVLGEALAGAVLVAAIEGARVDIQLECNGPLRGLLVDADGSGAVRGFVRVGDLESAGAGRFDPRPLLASKFDERAGVLSLLRAEEGRDSPHRAVFPFAGANLGAALTFYLRNDRAQGGEMALEAVLAEEPLVAGALRCAAPRSTKRCCARRARRGSHASWPGLSLSARCACGGSYSRASPAAVRAPVSCAPCGPSAKPSFATWRPRTAGLR